MSFEKSCGAVVYYKGSKGVEYLILHHHKPSAHFSFPKGHTEKDETDEETAKREIEEETGLTDVDLDTNFKSYIEYSFKSKEKTINKIVHFFVAETNSKNVTISHEHQDFLWLPYKEAFKKLTHENSKNILKQVKEYLDLKYNDETN